MLTFTIIYIVIFYESDDSHPATTIRAKEGINFIDLADHLRPASAGDKWTLFLNDRRMSRVLRFLMLFAAMGIRVEAVIADHQLAYLYSNMGDFEKALEIWKNADKRLSEVEDAKKRLAALR